MWGADTGGPAQSLSLCDVSSELSERGRPPVRWEHCTLPSRAQRGSEVWELACLRAPGDPRAHPGLSLAVLLPSLGGE